jgi:tRNA nucleotidyltransferase (CCA-adding enzyme)
VIGAFPEAPGYVRWITRTLEEAGFETWAVGGAIRNSLLGLPSGDWDLATRAPPKVVQRTFPRTVPIGVAHGTVGVLTRDGTLVEVTTFRRDVETTGRHAVVEFADTLGEDLARRDFTVNAVAWHPLNERYQDPFGGREDLADRILRAVGAPEERFAEDYLRVLRGLRFSGRFDLRIEDRTWRSLCSVMDHLPTLSAERIREELWKVLSEDPRPSAALRLYEKAGVLPVLYPEVDRLGKLPRGEGEESYWEHGIGVADVLPASRPLLRLMAVLQGMALEGGAESVASLLVRHRYSNSDAQAVVAVVGAGPEPPLHLQSGPSRRRWLYETGPHRLGTFGRLWLAKARLDSRRWGKDPRPVLGLLSALRSERAGRPPLSLEALAVDGRDLIRQGLKPGPLFGGILDRLMDQVLEDPDLNDRETLLSLVPSLAETEADTKGRAHGEEPK